MARAFSAFFLGGFLGTKLQLLPLGMPLLQFPSAGRIPYVGGRSVVWGSGLTTAGAALPELYPDTPTSQTLGVPCAVGNSLRSRSR